MPRPKSFDPEEKLRDAMRLFWRVGFERTSIPLLEEALGINRFSIYDTFGKKRALFIQVLDLYSEDLLKKLLLPLEGGSGGLEDLRTFLSGWRKIYGDEDVRGCLLVNTATDIGATDPEVAGRVSAYFERFEAAVCGCLKRAHRLGEIGGDEASWARRALGIRLAIQGALVTLASSHGKAAASQIAEAVEALGVAQPL